MLLPDVFFRWKRKVSGLDDVSEDAIIELVSNLLAILKAQVVSDKPGGQPHDLNQLVSKDQSLAC